MEGIQRLRKGFSEWKKESEGKAPSSKEVDEFVNLAYPKLIAAENESCPKDYPTLIHLSAAVIYRFMPVLQDRLQPEFVYVPIEEQSSGRDRNAISTSLFMTKWNTCWEAGEARQEMLRRKVPQSLKWLRSYTGRNIFLVPRDRRHRYYAYAPLFHMIPERILSRHGLPLIKEGFWPFFMEDPWLRYLIDDEFDDRLQRAFADLVWGKINTGSGLAAFSKSDPLKLLAHNLDFWLPYSYLVAQERLSAFPRVEIEAAGEESLMRELQGTAPKGLSFLKPRTGGYLWCGEEEADRALSELIETADRQGKFRAIVEAVRSNRMEDDFSDRWSFAKEDFERRLYRKRSKVSVTFVELDDTIPVHGPESEVEEDLLWEDFMGLLNLKERRIVILLRSGYTCLGDVAMKMGYANHSPISKALAKIRTKAERYLA